MLMICDFCQYTADDSIMTVGDECPNCKKPYFRNSKNKEGKQLWEINWGSRPVVEPKKITGKIFTLCVCGRLNDIYLTEAVGGIVSGKHTCQCGKKINISFCEKVTDATNKTSTSQQ